MTQQGIITPHILLNDLKQTCKVVICAPSVPLPIQTHKGGFQNSGLTVSVKALFN